MNSYENFSSLPPDEERQFAVYEQHSVLAEKQGIKLALIVAGAVAGVVLLFAVLVKPPERDADEQFGIAGGDENGEQTDQLGAE